MITLKKKKGNSGEMAVCTWLKKHRYKILECQYSTRYGEIDIVAKNRNYICFTEVKTRSQNSMGRPANAVNLQKQGRIIKSAYHYLKYNQTELMARFDVAEVIIDDNGKYIINYIENAFSVNSQNFHNI